MSSLTRFLALLALALLSFAVANGAEAGVHHGSALSSFGRSSPAQTVQFGGANCYYADGWNGRGWYQCGDEWNDGFGWIGPFNYTFGDSAIRRHHRHGVVVSHPRAPNPVYPRLEPSRRLGAGAFRRSILSPAVQPRVALAPAVFQPRLTSTPALRPSPPVLPAALAAAIFITFTAREFPTSGRLSRPGLLAAEVFMGLAGPRESTSARLPPGFAGAEVSMAAAAFMGLAGPEESTSARLPPQVLRASEVSMPAMVCMGLAGPQGSTSARLPPQVLSASVPDFHGFGGGGGAHIGAFASPGFAGGGFHGFGGGGVFQGGGAPMGQGGIGHR